MGNLSPKNIAPKYPFSYTKIGKKTDTTATCAVAKNCAQCCKGKIAPNRATTNAPNTPPPNHPYPGAPRQGGGGNIINGLPSIFLKNFPLSLLSRTPFPLFPGVLTQIFQLEIFRPNFLDLSQIDRLQRLLALLF